MTYTHMTHRPCDACYRFRLATENCWLPHRRTQSGPPGYSPGKGGGKFDSDVFNGLDTLYPGGTLRLSCSSLHIRQLAVLAHLSMLVASLQKFYTVISTSRTLQSHLWQRFIPSDWHCRSIRPPGSG